MTQEQREAEEAINLELNTPGGDCGGLSTKFAKLRCIAVRDRIRLRAYERAVERLRQGDSPGFSVNILERELEAIQ